MTASTVATRALRIVLACALALGSGACRGEEGRATGTSAASTATATTTGTIPDVPAEKLPVEARQTLRLIDAGGPFPYPKDGTTFRNRERILPREPSGYYREYTVPTPGSRDRGARRIIAGKAGERYYTGDHYRSFVRVVRG